MEIDRQPQFVTDMASPHWWPQSRPAPPIFCDCCPVFAVAELGRRPLCIGCLVDEVRASSDSRIIEQIRPLRIF